MYNFPKNLYTDVRIDDVFETSIRYENNIMRENNVRRYKGVFIRIYDGERWYFQSTTNINNIQKEIDDLSKIAKENRDIYSTPIIKKLEVNIDKLYSYKGIEIDKVSQPEKEKLVYEVADLIEFKEEIKSWTIIYSDKKVEKQFYSSKGSNLSFDHQASRITAIYNIVIDNNKDSHISMTSSCDFKDLQKIKEKFEIDYKKNCNYVKHAKPISPGKYTVVMAPSVTGVFAHESFGHKSEADTMIGDESMLREWKIGSKVGSEILSIYDSGDMNAAGYCPYDDEGNKGKKTYLIKDGILKGRLHSAETAADIKEEVTGNSRAINFEFEPIVRMTSTVVEGGYMTLEELICDIEEGVLLDYWKHGSGLSTFTIAPSRSYMIRNGKIAEPIKVAVATGNVMETLFNVDGVSKEVEVCMGECGKNEQFGLSVAMGGPYMRIKNLQLQ